MPSDTQEKPFSEAIFNTMSNFLGMNVRFYTRMEIEANRDGEFISLLEVPEEHSYAVYKYIESIVVRVCVN